MAEMLKGLKVIDYATYIAAPGAAGIFADWGADVIKVEPPGGDPIRLFFATVGIEASGVNPVWEMDNRGKRGIALDTTKDAGREVLLRLIDGADVFLTNVRPGGLKRSGLDHEAVLQRNPRLIYASLTGYGLDGPDAERPGMDAAAFWAHAGLAALFRPKGGEPMQLRTAFGDHVTAMALAAGVLAALHERSSTGKGRLVEASLLRAAHYAAASDLSIQHTYGRVASNRPRREAPLPLVNFFKTKDERWLNLLARQGEGDWAHICRALKLGRLSDDARFATARARRKNAGDLVDMLDAAFAQLTLAEAAAALDAEQIVWAPMLSAAEAVVDPQTIAAGAVVQTPQRNGASIKAPASPVRFPGADDGPKGPAPTLGEHTRAVLAELGYSDAEIDALYACGAVV
ncbi:putative hydroxyproline dehydratase [alpha proteobacterium U9-1i]|nr:putative hydroxyproline dehydratase [alpha proteobacterium U9-1i]